MGAVNTVKIIMIMKIKEINENKVENNFLSCETISIPKIILPCVEILARFTHRTIDEFLTELVVIGLADFYQESEQVVYSMKDYKRLFKRLKRAFDKDEIYQNRKTSKGKKKLKNNTLDEEEIKFSMNIPEDLMYCIERYCTAQIGKEKIC